MILPNIGWLWLMVPLVAVPLVIHLLNRKFPKVIQFPNVENIRKAMAQRSKLFRMRHLIMLLLRTLALILLVLVFLKPLAGVFGAAEKQAGDRHVVILYDHSLSMGYKGGSMSSARRAQVEVEKIVDKLAPEDLANLIVAGRHPALCFPEFSLHHQELAAFVKRLPTAYAKADFNKAIAELAKLTGGLDGRLDVYVVSDFQRKNWADVQMAGVPEGARVFFVDVAAEVRHNRGLQGARMLDPNVLMNEPARMEVTVGNYSDVGFDDSIEVVINDSHTSRVAVQVRPWSVARVVVPVTLRSQGLHVIKVALPEDNLAADNEWFLTVPVMEKEEVVVLTDESELERQSAYFIKTALNPYADQGGAILPKFADSADFSAIDLAGVRKLFITRVGRLNEKACEVIARFTAQGGGVVYFLDGVNDAHNVKALDTAMGSGSVPFQLGPKQSVKNIAGGAQQIRRGDFQSRFLTIFRGQNKQNLAFLEFFEYYHAVPTGKGRVLLSYADDSPAMGLVHSGLGTMLLCNFSVSEMASNVARQRLFPAWVHDMVRRLDNAEVEAEAYAVGDEIQTEVWKQELMDDAFRSPSGTSLRVKRELAGDRFRVTFGANERGIYKLGDKPVTYAFAVNVDGDESDLRAVDTARLAEQAGKARSWFVKGQKDYQQLETGKPLYHYAVFAVFALLMLETGLAKVFRSLSR